MVGGVARAGTDRPPTFAQLLARARVAVGGRVTGVDSYDSGRLTVARVRTDRTLKGSEHGDVAVVENHDLPSEPDLVHTGDAALLFLVPAAHSSSLTRTLPPGRYFEPASGRHGVVAGTASEVAEATQLVGRLVAMSATPEPDPVKAAALRRALVFDEIAAHHPRVLADGAAALPGLREVGAAPTDDERHRLEAALARTDLPTWVRVALVESIGAAKLTALAPALRTLPHPEPVVLEASWTALRQLGAPPDAEDLRPALASSDAAVRAAATRAVLAADGPDALARVGHMALADPSPDVRGAAAEALGQTRLPAALPQLEQVFSAGDWPTRQAAGRAISLVGGRPAQETFARLAFEGQPDAQGYAVTLLLLSGVSHDDPLVQWIRTAHPDAAVRRLTEQGLPKLEH